MKVELSNKNPGNTNKGHLNAVKKPVAEKKDSSKNIDEKEKEKKDNPLFYTIPIFKAKRYEFY